MTDNYKVATAVGRLFKTENSIQTVEGWNCDKEYATIAEKAMNFSQRSGKNLNETVKTKRDELNNGMILAKEHNFDDFTRGFIAGWFLGADVTETGIEELLKEVEDFWSKKWFSVETTKQKEEMYSDVIITMKKKKAYKDKGMITLQELTRKCLQAMENGLGDKYIITPRINDDLIVKGNIITDKDDINRNYYRPSSVDLEDVIVMI